VTDTDSFLIRKAGWFTLYKRVTALKYSLMENNRQKP